MSDLIDTTEMFLKAIYELNEVGAPAMRARLAERLDQAVPTVSQTIARMEREGLVSLDEDRHVVLTALGALRATSVLRKHRMAERLLHDVLKLEWAKCHDEACRWEHVITDEAELLIAGLLPTLAADPYGNPIPGLELLGLARASKTPSKVALSDAVSADEAEFQLASIGEVAQARPHFLRTLADAGIGIGSTITVRRTAGVMTIAAAAAGVQVELDRHLAEQIFVVAGKHRRRAG